MILLEPNSIFCTVDKDKELKIRFRIDENGYIVVLPTEETSAVTSVS